MSASYLIALLFLLFGLVGFGIGYLAGTIRSKRKSRKEWDNDIAPTLKRLETERNTLWRSAVTKTQKLNRIAREQNRR